MVLESVNKTLSPNDPITRSKTRNEMQDVRWEKPAYPDSIYRSLPKPT